jgi:hypothetical protein
MRARVWNAPARPRLTGLIIAVLSTTLLAFASLAFVNEPPRRQPAALHRPVFARRMVTLPPILVTAPEPPQPGPSGDVQPR